MKEKYSYLVQPVVISLKLPFIINLNLRGLKPSIKRHRVAKWIKKQLPVRESICLCGHRLKVKRWKKILHVNGNQESRDSSTHSSKTDFKLKTEKGSQVWCHRPVIPATEKLRQENCEFQASLAYIKRPGLKTRKER